MIIDLNNPCVMGLVHTWNSALVRSSDLSQNLQKRLVREVISPAIQGFKGELVLKYRESLRVVPTGGHSFAHGSEMISTTVYWVSVGRIADGEIVEVPRGTPQPRGPEEKLKFVFVKPREFLVSNLWSVDLSPRYRHSGHPYFVVASTKFKEKTSTFDVAYFGGHLFSQNHTALDWATKVVIAIGNESVREWLVKTKSARTYNQLSRK